MLITTSTSQLLRCNPQLRDCMPVSAVIQTGFTVYQNMNCLRRKSLGVRLFPYYMASFRLTETYRHPNPIWLLSDEPCSMRWVITCWTRFVGTCQLTLFLFGRTFTISSWRSSGGHLSQLHVRCAYSLSCILPFNSPIVALLPYTIFSLFHALTFTRTSLMPQILPHGPPLTAGGPPQPHPLAKKLQVWVKGLLGHFR